MKMAIMVQDVWCVHCGALLTQPKTHKDPWLCPNFIPNKWWKFWERHDQRHAHHTEADRNWWDGKFGGFSFGFKVGGHTEYIQVPDMPELEGWIQYGEDSKGRFPKNGFFYDVVDSRHGGRCVAMKSISGGFWVGSSPAGVVTHWRELKEQPPEQKLLRKTPLNKLDFYS